MDKNIIPVESIQERDVDMILLEELNSDDTFCKWFVDELSLPPLSEVTGAWKSISDFGLGETDILFCYNSFGKSIFVLIENKLDASFQDEQFNRYTKRADNYKVEKKCDEVYVVLFAPNQYCKNQSDFERFIPYESVLERMQETSSKRGLFKSELLQIAIDKLRRGYQVKNNPVVQHFWIEYWKLSREYLSDFVMPKPTIKPLRSDWPRIKHRSLKNIRFCHKLSSGNVDVEFLGNRKDLKKSLKSIVLPNGILLKNLKKTMVLRVKVSKVDKTFDFNLQKEKIVEGFDAMKSLKDFLFRVKFLDK